MDTSESKLGAARAVLAAYLLAFVQVCTERLPTHRGREAFTQMATDNRAQAGGNLVSLVIGIAVAVVVAVGVAIPITNQVIADSNISGLTLMIVEFIPVMLGVLVFVATTGPIMRRT